MEDSYRHKGLRQQLIRELERKGINNQAVLNAINRVPRHAFLDKAFDEWAYKDTAFPIDCDQTISQPYTVAYQTHLLDLKPKDKVLEIGLGSGYQAAVLYEMGAKVYSIERQKLLYEKTSKLLNAMGYGNIRTFYGDGYLGLPRFAPFDKILVTAGATELPSTLLEQLKPGGVIVIPVGKSGDQIMYRISKLEDGKIKKEKFGHFRFVPFLHGES